MADKIRFEGARLIYKNFSGRPTEWNKDGGVRTASLVIEDATVAESLKDEGWNVKINPPYEEGDDPFCTLPIFVKFDSWYPTNIFTVTGDIVTRMDADTISELDGLDIVGADVKLRPYEWDTGRIKAYVETMYAVVEEDPFAAKYRHEEC